MDLLPWETFKNHSNTEGSSELLSPLTVSPGERWPAASLCGWTADAFRGWSNLTARSLRAPLPGITSAYTSSCQCSEGSPTQLSEQRPALRTKILGPSTDGLRGPTAGFYLLKAFRLNRVLQSILLPIQWHGVRLTTNNKYMLQQICLEFKLLLMITIMSCVWFVRLPASRDALVFCIPITIRSKKTWTSRLLLWL